MPPLAYRQICGHASAAARNATVRAAAAWRRLTIPNIRLDEDRRRKGYLLNSILVISISLFSLLGIVVIWNYMTMDAYEGMRPEIFASLVIFCIAIYAISRTGHIRTASYLLISFYAVGTIYAGWIWGASLPGTMFGVAMVIVTTGIFMGPVAGAVASALIVVIFAMLGIHEEDILLIPDWKSTAVNDTDILTYSAGFLFIGFIAWLSSKEIKGSLDRALKSEKALREERDNLEKRISERTASLIEAERQKMAGLENAARFGELSKGLFHDLMNPLTAISARMQSTGFADDSDKIEIGRSVDAAVSASKRMGQFMESVRHCMGYGGGDPDNSTADMREEAAAAKDILGYQARRKDIAIDISAIGPQLLAIDPIRLNQVFLNLISNAIEAFPDKPDPEKDRVIAVSTEATEDSLLITVKDNGPGMQADAIGKVFDAGYSSRPGGTGIGLATVKTIVEDELHGSIKLESRPGNGASFMISVPIEHIAHGQRSDNRDIRKQSGIQE
ncbi:MAG: GHKL domain-containing protein [Patescibacteria group bacterium]|nr:GHKL domain-containing protein [Patescibacteria group bacterium]